MAETQRTLGETDAQWLACGARSPLLTSWRTPPRGYKSGPAIEEDFWCPNLGAYSGGVDGPQGICRQDPASAVPSIRPRRGGVSPGANEDDSAKAIAASGATRFAGGLLGRPSERF